MSWIPPKDDPEIELRDRPEAVWRPAIDTIAARHGLEGDRRPFDTGSDVVWSVGDRVVKLGSPRWSAQIDDEAANLEHVDGRLPVRTPEPIAVGELSGWPYLVMTRVPGIALGEAWSRLDTAGRSRLAARLGELVRALHDLPGEGPSKDWEPYWMQCRARLPGCHRHPDVPAALFDEIGPFLEEVGDLHGGAPVFLHTEVLHQHVLVDGSSPEMQPCGMIDFADARMGPPEYEFAAPVEFVFRGEPGMLRSFLRAYGSPEAELDEGRSLSMLAWALSHRFGSLRRMLDAVAPWSPSSLADLARRLYSFGES